MLAGILSILTSGAGGGLIGGIMGLFRQSSESKERVALAKLAIERDSLEYREANLEREHQLVMLNSGAKIELDKIITETEAQAEIATVTALGKAQKVFAKLKTSSWMDNYRASVRPTFAYFVMAMFTVFLAWSFNHHSEGIGADQGGVILIGLLDTLVFMVTSITSFYFVSRPNTK
tara:strand:- start:488 stop:1015 length:528 start_codon:yes stop_codon:yes gene_type:complete